jgi:hypothetical protein
LISIMDWAPTHTTLPSAGASTTHCAAMLPLAPALISMITGRASVPVMWSAMMRE